MGTDGPRAMPATARKSSSWKWWPGTESNHRHAYFQYGGEPGSARSSRRPRRSFHRADRTDLCDRAYSEPRGQHPIDLRAKPKTVKESGASRPNAVRTCPPSGAGTRRGHGNLETWESGNLAACTAGTVSDFRNFRLPHRREPATRLAQSLRHLHVELDRRELLGSHVVLS